MKTFVIPIDVYNRDVLVHIGKIKPLRKYLGKFLCKNMVAEVCAHLCNCSLGKTLEIDNSGIVVYMPNYSDSAKDRAILTHELFHATYMILQKAGIDCTDVSDEAYAYLLQCLVEKTFTSLSFSQQPLFSDASQHKTLAQAARFRHHESS